MTVRLYPLPAEHVLPLLLDLVFFAVCCAAWLVIFGTVDGLAATFGVLAAVVLFHVIQVTLLVAVHFDDEGITIIRPWRRRRVAWSQVTGLIYTQGLEAQGRAPYKLRLGLTGNEPPFGRYLSRAELGRYATGPVVMSLTDLEEDLHAGVDRRSVRCQQRVYAELERHGFPKPPPRVLEFRSPKYTPEEASRAVAEDFLRRRQPDR